jgi:CheY-like chemotaxis protein
MQILAASWTRIRRHVLRALNPRIASRHVLVVDDEPSMCEFLRAVLRAAGHRVVTATSGDQAIAKYRVCRPFDVLLTDVVMPRMSGDELAERLRADDPTLKVIYLTGSREQLLGRRVLLSVDETLLEKPCTPASVLDAIALLVDLRRQDRPIWT